jgi:acetoin utilization deacetylase AcuC-like enzyme
MAPPGASGIALLWGAQVHGEERSLTTGYVWQELYAWHNTGMGGRIEAPHLVMQPHPHFESPDTKSRLASLVEVSGLIEELQRIRPRAASEEDLVRVHAREHVESIRRQSLAGGGDAGDGASPFGAGSFEIACLAAGGTIAATEAVLAGAVENAYALVRPPGHHAIRATGMGLCLFANVAVAIEWARATNGIRRVAVVDWDVHHGNGTQSIFEADPDVLTISIHQDSLFPPNGGSLDERGVDAGHGSVINVPLPAGSGNGAYVDATVHVVLPALQAFRPEIIFIASGFDAGALDPLAQMVVTSSGYREMTRLVMGAARGLCGGRLVLSHEGGYSPIYVPYCGLAVLEELTGHATGVVDPYEPTFVNLPAQTTTEAQRAVIERASRLVERIAPR